MISIRINNVPLRMYPNAVMELERFNPALSEDGIPDDFSLPMTVPVEGNEKLLGHVQNIEVAYKETIIEDVEVLWKDTFQYRGSITILGATAIEIELSVTVAPLALMAAQTNLRDIDFGDPIDVGPDADDLIAHAIAVNNQSYPEATHCFPPHQNPDLYSKNDDWSDDPLDGNMVVNHWRGIDATFSKNGLDNGKPSNWHAMIPFFYSLWILGRVMRHFGYQMKGEVLNDPDMNKMVEFSNTALDHKEDRLYVKAGYSAGNSEVGFWPALALIGDDDSTLPHIDIDDLYDPTTGYYTVQEAGNIAVTVHCHASLDAVSAVTVVLEEVGGVGVGTIASSPSGLEHDLDGILYWNPTAGDIGSEFYLLVLFPTPAPNITVTDLEVEFFHTAESHLNIFADQIIIKDHVPDQTVGEYILGFKKGLGIGFSVDSVDKSVDLFWNDRSLFNSGKLKDLTPMVTGQPEFEFGQKVGFTIQFGASDVGIDDLPDTEGLEFSGAFNTPDDLPDIFDLGLYAISLSDHKVWVIERRSLAEWWILEWKHSGYWHWPVVIGDGENDISPDWSPMMMSYVEMNGEEHLIPVVAQRGNTLLYNEGYQKPDLRKAFYHGMQSGPTFNYPFASPYRYDHSGVLIGANDLRLGEPDGLYDLRLKNLLQHLHEPEWCIVDLNATPEFVRDHHYAFIYLYRGTAYLIEELPVVYGQNDISISEARLLKLKPWIQ